MPTSILRDSNALGSFGEQRGVSTNGGGIREGGARGQVVRSRLAAASIKILCRPQVRTVPKTCRVCTASSTINNATTLQEAASTTWSKNGT